MKIVMENFVSNAKSYRYKCKSELIEFNRYNGDISDFYITDIRYPTCSTIDNSSMEIMNEDLFDDRIIVVFHDGLVKYKYWAEIDNSILMGYCLKWYNILSKCKVYVGDISKMTKSQLNNAVRDKAADLQLGIHADEVGITNEFSYNLGLDNKVILLTNIVNHTSFVVKNIHFTGSGPTLIVRVTLSDIHNRVGLYRLRQNDQFKYLTDKKNKSLIINNIINSYSHEKYVQNTNY